MVKIKDAENTILMELKNGTVTIELLPDIAPVSYTHLTLPTTHDV